MVSSKTGAAFKRGNSEQEVRTPPEFLDAVRGKFYPTIRMDLAASQSTSVARESLLFVGPGSQFCEDFSDFDLSLVKGDNGLYWLNPPFANIAPFAKRCADELSNRPGHTLMLVPASTGAKWFQFYVHGKSVVHMLRPRLTFVGHNAPYPKDLVLAAYGFGASGYVTWKWK